MDTEALRTFLSVYREKGFSSAARALRRTQPAISTRIRLLEQELGAPLFERTANGIVLSQAGRILVPYAEAAVAAVQDAENAVRHLQTEISGPLDLALVGTLAGPRLTDVLKLLVAKHPSVSLTLQTARSTDVSELVRAGKATVGLRYERDRSVDLHCEQVGTEELVIVCGAKHPLAGKTVPSLTPLTSARWLAFPESPEGETWDSHISRIFFRHGLGPVSWSQVDSLTAQKRLVEADFGLALLPSNGVLEELTAQSLKIIKVKRLNLRQPIILVTRSKGFLSSAAKYLIGLLRQEFRP